MSKKRLVEQESTCLIFRGAAGGEVTGSCTELVLPDGRRILVDCGMRQGREMWTETHQLKDASCYVTKARIGDIEAIMATHGHVDHMARIPYLVGQGYHGPVLTTYATAQLMGPLLEDSAVVQQRNYDRQVRLRGPDNVLEKDFVLYRQREVDKTLRLLNKVEPYKEIPARKRDRSVLVTFYPNGHMIGSASVRLRIPPNGHEGKSIVFSGDVGRKDPAITDSWSRCSRFYPQEPLDALVLESTKGDCEPISEEQKITELLSTLKEVWDGGGNPIFPVLANRLPEVMELLFNLQKDGRLPPDCKFVVDAPLGLQLLEIIKYQCPDYLGTGFGTNPNYYPTDNASLARFESKNLIIIGSNQESLQAASAYTNYPGKVVIIAGGGMALGGRIYNYINTFGANPRNAVIQTCYQVPGTKGEEWQRAGNVDPVARNKAYVVNVGGFTGHASGRELVDFALKWGEPKMIILNHGSIHSQTALAELLKSSGISSQVILPRIGQPIPL